MQKTTLKLCPSGEYIKLRNTDSAPIWIKGNYDRLTKTYSLLNVDDINREIFRKSNSTVFIGFTY
jgi:hypothetical protein